MLFCHGAKRTAREFRAAIPRVAVRESLTVLITLRRDDVSWCDKKKTALARPHDGA